MDRNTITGLLMLSLVLILFNIYTGSQEEEEIPATEEAVENVGIQEGEATAASNEALLDSNNTKASIDTTLVDSSNAVPQGPFASQRTGESQTTTIENDDLKIELSNKGGRIVNVELKGYRKHDSTALNLFEEQNTEFHYLFAIDGETVNTDDFYFDADNSGFTISGEERKSISYRLTYAEGVYLEQIYSIGGSGYIIDYDLKLVGLDNKLEQGKDIQLEWEAEIQPLEKGIKVEKRNSTIHYKYVGDAADDLASSGDDELSVQTPLNWVSFKQQFFNVALISHANTLSRGNLEVKEYEEEEKLKTVYADLFIPVTLEPEAHNPLQFYIGPNHYSTLKKMDIELETVIPLGWGPLSYVNTWLIIPVFNFLNKFIGNFGIIILLLTIFIKLLLSFFTYKSYVSTAKMKLLKPELEELKKKFTDSQKLNVEQMKLYRQAGVNPLGGCLPMLLQFPFLVAMFYFFPSSIELRQQSFLWATDLSTYDSIYEWSQEIPILSDVYGNHISLFTLLMTISTVLATKLNSQMSDPTGQMAQMKYIQYLMPIMFLGIFNDFSAALTYYYLLANLITFGQQYVIKNYIVNDEKLHAQLQQNKKKKPKESAFQKRLEQMTKDAQAKQRDRNKKK